MIGFTKSGHLNLISWIYATAEAQWANRAAGHARWPAQTPGSTAIRAAIVDERTSLNNLHRKRATRSIATGPAALFPALLFFLHPRLQGGAERISDRPHLGPRSRTSLTDARGAA